MNVLLVASLIFCSLFATRVAVASDTTAYATPDPPPTLHGRGTTMVDPVFGSTVIQLSDETTDSAYSVGLSYSSHFAMNYNSTYFLGLYNTSVGGGVWKTTQFNPTTFAVGASTALPANCKFDPQRWDVSGRTTDLSGAPKTWSNILYCFSEGSAATNRQLREWDAAAHTLSLPFADFEVDLRRSGTITSATDSSHFAASAYVSPVTDMATHFEVGQVVTFTSGALNGQTQTITAFTDAGGAFVTNAFTGSPGVGDTFYARPSGFPSEFNVSPDGRYFIAGLQQSNVSGIGGSDTGHILLVYDRTANQKYVHYFSLAAFGGPSECVTKCGWHQMQVDKAPGSHYIWASIGSVTDVLIDFIAGTVVHLYPDALGHADTSVDSRIVTTAGVAAQAKMAYYAASSPSTLVDVLTTVTKCGLTDNNTGRHTSWSLDATKILASTYLTPPNSGGNQAVSNSQWVADGAPIYRMDNFTTQKITMCPLTPANLGEVWDNQDVLTYTGTTKASIVASGQWAFDPNGSSGKGQLWVRGKVDSVLTDSAQTTRISAFDWRLFLDEITLVYTDELPGNTQKWTRLAKAFSRTSGIGASETSWTPRASLSPDGHFAVFTSTWGHRLMNNDPNNPPRRDLFAVVIGAAPTPTPDPPPPPTNLTISSDGTLTWPPSTDATLAGYHLYRGTSPGVYTLRIDLTPSIAIANHSPLTRYIDHPPVGGTYYYVVAAVLANGNESTTSVEVSRVVGGQTARAVRQ